MIVFIRTFTQLQNLYLLESYTYYNVIFKNKNVLYIINKILFLSESYEFTNIKSNLFIVQENTSVYLDGIRLAQSERKEKGS